MLLNVLKKYSGVLFFYLVIVIMVFLISARFKDLRTMENADERAYAMSVVNS